ncbi:MAG: maleylpyruvate isomerase [Pseudomonadota bacterium]
MSLSDADRAAREALRARQGQGARYDAPEAPAEDLLRARRATAGFARILNGLTDFEIAASDMTAAGLRRAEIIAAVGYDARRTALALEDLVASADRSGSIALPSPDLAATLPARALRHLFEHSAIHLDTCWRDLPGSFWEARLQMGDGVPQEVRDLPRRRADLLGRHIRSLDRNAA